MVGQDESPHVLPCPKHSQLAGSRQAEISLAVTDAQVPQSVLVDRGTRRELQEVA
jgi:hypothetical protein